MWAYDNPSNFLDGRRARIKNINFKMAIYLKFIYYEKATKFFKISHNVLMLLKLCQNKNGQIFVVMLVF